MKPLLKAYDPADDEPHHAPCLNEWWPSWLSPDAVSIKVGSDQTCLTLNEADLFHMVQEIRRKREAGAA